ncbi:MAG: hypothetical protein K0U38_05460, partial [Epsilonproteobacteria bacterium]|nr:hypothetical protein [Campylobacterota bacterium]
SKTIITQIQEDKNISNIRDEIGADEVIIYRPYVKHDICGIAYINHGQVDYAFAHISINCSSYHTAHEVGHSMGLYHSIKEHPHVGYARGHGVENEFSTIMSYTENFNANKIYKFSSPKLNCNGFPCGIEEGEEYEADAVKALQSNAFNLSKFKTHTVTLEELKKAKQQYEKYRDEFTSISQTLEKIQEEYQKVEEAYNQTLSVSKAEINNYQKRKSEYLRLKNNLLITKAQKYYDKSLRPLTEKLKKYKFSNLYVTLTKKNKLEQTYKTYKSNIYDIAQQKLERAEQFYFKLQNLYGVNNAD